MKWYKYLPDINRIIKENPDFGGTKILNKLKEIHPTVKFPENSRVHISRIKNGKYHNDFEEQLEQANFETPDNWSHGWHKVKGGHSIFIKNQNQTYEVSLEQMREDMVSFLKTYSPKFEALNYGNIKGEHCLIIDIADLHIGKLSSGLGDDYDSNTSIQRAKEGVSGLLCRAQGYPIEKVIFVIGNDVLHVDGTNNSTTSGTRQDVDKMWYDNFKLAKKLYIELIGSLAQSYEVEIIHCPSNHDYETGFLLADVIQTYFRNNKRIKADISIRHRKYTKYGNSLIGLTHGDGAKLDKLHTLMAHESGSMWVECYYKYMYTHHVHHKQIYKFLASKDYFGVNVQSLRSPSGADLWHHKNGYQHAPKAITGFIHHIEDGEVNALNYPFK